MKVARCLSAIFIVLIASALVSAQSVIVRPRKVVYRRTIPKLSDFKRTFEVRYPVLSGKLKPGVLQKLKSGTDYWKVFEISLAENLREDTWLSSLDYQVTYNKNNIFDIALTMEGSGAYPDGSTEHHVFDLRTGRELTYSDIFQPAKLTELLAKIRTVMQQKEDQAVKESDEVRETLAGFRRDEPEFYPPIEKVEFKDLDGFSISDTGVTFFYDYNYAHVVQALEPFDEISLSYRDLKPFIRTDGLLAQFVR